MKQYGFWYNVRNIPYWFKRGFRNLIKWGPTIWKDEDWDYYFIYKVFHKKLKDTYDFLNGPKAVAMHQRKNLKNLKICYLLLERLMKDDYGTMSFKRHYEIWGEPEISTTPVPDSSELHEVLIKHKNVITKEDEERERKGFNKCSEHEQMLIKQDLELFAKLFKKNVRCWWD
jgi:hypothetical protein